MVKNAPVYLVYTDSDDFAHICVGVEPETLCNKKGVKSAVQIQDVKKPIEKLKDNGEVICTNCQKKWDDISDNISLERTINCHRCNSVYSARLAAVVEHIDAGKTPVCKPCYEELKETSSSGVETPYEDAEKYYPQDSSRSVDKNITEK